MTTTERLLTTAQVATMLGKSTRTVQRMADTGELPFVQKLTGSRGAYVFDPAVVELARQRQEAHSMPTQDAFDGVEPSRTDRTYSR
jgi:excisionase family DNA binding protein